MNIYFKKILVLSMFIPSLTFAQMSVTVTDTVADQIDCANITHNLKLGSKDANTSGDVTTLQVYLSQANFLDSDPTGYFGRATRKAVQDFQTANSISPAGNVGPYTRAKIKELSCIGVTTNTNTIKETNHTSTKSITSDLYVYPASGVAPLTVMWKGPQDVMAKVEKCVYSMGWYGTSGNGLQVDWGDGTNAIEYSASTAGTSCAAAASKHTYAKEGTYTIKVRSWHPGPTDAPVTDWEGSTNVQVTRRAETTNTTTTVTGDQVAKIDLKVNGSDDAFPLSGTQTVKLTWTTTGVTGCKIEVAGVGSTIVPNSGSQETSINPDWTSYVSLSCKRTNNSEIMYDYVKMSKVTPVTQVVSTEVKTATISPAVVTHVLPSVKVISPNGGEVFTADSDMRVYWTVSGLTTHDSFVIKLIGEGKEITLGTRTQEVIKEMMGTDHFVLSSMSAVTPGKYKVRINVIGEGNAFVATDISDDSVIIK